ncbi:hypothetical protein B0H17DRAFT_1018834, partial [Mycena rosella]
MAEEYGGSAQMTYPKIAKAIWKKTRMRYFMYLNLLYNPICPEIPGAPGLLFDATCLGDESDDSDDEGAAKRGGEETKEKESRDDSDDSDGEGAAKQGGEETKKKKSGEDSDDSELEDDGSSILFSRLDRSTWQYQGQYVTAPAAPLTIEEWKQQSPQVRKTWAKQLSIKSWGRPIRADIVLRRQLGRQPTKAEKNAALDTDNKFKTVTPEEISAAFDRGEVIIVVSTLQCVGYNTD